MITHGNFLIKCYYKMAEALLTLKLSRNRHFIAWIQRPGCWFTSFIGVCQFSPYAGKSVPGPSSWPEEHLLDGAGRGLLLVLLVSHLYSLFVAGLLVH
jgi:hypothetical protein